MEPLTMHMMTRLDTICDIAILQPQTTQGINFNKTTVVRVPMAKANSLISFCNGGTGFIVSKNSIIVQGISQKFALILTAAHVVYDIYSEKPLADDFSCKLENGSLRLAFPIKEFTKEMSERPVSGITGANYCISGDAALLLIQLEEGDHVMHYEINREDFVGNACCVSGYPRMPRDMRYSVPQIYSSTKQEIEKQARDIFHNFNCLVYSEGKIERHSEALIEVSCSTTNGMSGSPIIVNEKVVGIYVGGPPLPGQQQVVSILKNIYQEKEVTLILQDISSLQAFDHFYTEEIFKDISNDSKFLKADVINRFILKKRVSDEEKKRFNTSLPIEELKVLLSNVMLALALLLGQAITLTVIYYRDKREFLANVGISARSGFFIEILGRIDKFSRLDVADSIESIINQLR